MPIQDPVGPEFEGSEPFLIAIGRLVTASALLESEIDWIVRHLIYPLGDGKFRDDLGHIVTADFDFRKKVDMLRALVDNLSVPDEALAEMAGVAQEAHALYNERNNFIHAIWAPGRGHDTRTLHRASARGGKFKFEMRRVNPAEISALADRFIAAANRVETAITKYLIG